MQITIDTQTEELEDLKHTLAILQDLIKKRENEYQEPVEEQEQAEEPQVKEPPVEKPIPRPAPREEFKVDMSALSKSDYGVKRGKLAFPSAQQSPSSTQEPVKNKTAVIQDIIRDLKNRKSYGQAIQMSEIVAQAQSKNINETETRKIVSELQSSGNI